MKILVVKLCCIGDVVFLTPALRSLRAAFPSAVISHLSAGWVRDIVEQVPSIDNVIVYEAPFGKGRWIPRFLETVRLVLRLRDERFDVIIIGHRSRFFLLLAWLSGIPRRIGFADRPTFMLTDFVKFRPDEYEIHRYQSLVSLLNVPPAGDRTEIRPPEDEAGKINSLFAEWKLGGGDRLVGILPAGGENPGTIMHIKRWDPASYVQFCQKLLARFPVTILLLGSASDRTLNEEIAGNLEHGRALNIAGKYGLRSLPALLQRCHAVIGGDSGPTHLASAVGTPTMFLFGPSDPRLVAPRQANSIHLWKHPACSPCYTPETVLQKKYFRGKTFICWTGTHECLGTLSVDEVMDAFSRLLQ